MRAALYGVDVVDVRIDILVEIGVVGHRHLDGHAVFLGVEVDDVLDQRCLAGIDVFHELLEALLAEEYLAFGVALFVEQTHVGERQRDAGVEERQVAQTVGEGLVIIDGLREDGGVRMEDNGRSRVVGFSDSGQLAGRLSVGVFLHVDLSVAVDFGAQVVGERVHAAHAYAVETAGNLVGAFVEFTAGMKYGKYHLECRLVHLFVHVDGDASSVVDHLDRVVLKDGDLDVGGIARQRLID